MIGVNKVCVKPDDDNEIPCDNTNRQVRPLTHQWCYLYNYQHLLGARPICTQLHDFGLLPLVTAVLEMYCSNQIAYSRSAYSIEDMLHMVHGVMYRISAHHNYGQPPKKKDPIN